MNAPQNVGDNGSPQEKPTLAVDFDGVIYSGPWLGSDAPLDPAAIVQGAKEALGILRQKFCVVIFTCRAYTGFTSKGDYAEGHADKVEKFLRDNEIPFDVVTTFPGKISADAYIDDKAINFSGDWFGTVTAALNFKAWNATR